MTTSNEFACEFCNRAFRSERTLLSHACRQKLRSQAQHEPTGRLAFSVYEKFYQITQRKARTWQQFAESPYYNAFIKFSGYMRSMNVVNPMLFVEWVIKQEIKLDRWASDATYERYLTQLLSTESADNAIERSLHTMQDWADKHSVGFNQYLYHAGTNRIISDIIAGRLSPWLLYGTRTGQEVLAAMNEEQANLIIKYVNPDVWAKKLQKESDQIDLVRIVCEQAGIS